MLTGAPASYKIARSSAGVDTQKRTLAPATKRRGAPGLKPEGRRATA